MSTYIKRPSAHRERIRGLLPLSFTADKGREIQYFSSVVSVQICCRYECDTSCESTLEGHKKLEIEDTKCHFKSHCEPHELSQDRLKGL